MLESIIPYSGNIVNKKFQRRRFRRRFFLLSCSDSKRRAGDSYLSAFQATPPWRQLSPVGKLQHRESRSRLSVFLQAISRKPARRASRVLIFPLSPLLRGLGVRLRRPRAILYITNIYNNVCLTGAFFKLFWGSFFRRKFAF